MQQIKGMLKDVFFNRFMLEDFAWYALASIVLCAICCILLLFFAGRKKKILCCLLTEYIFLVLCFTVICHKKEELDQLLPISFNDYSHWGIGALWSEWIINILMFVPIGALLKVAFNDMRWYHAMAIAFAISLSIELLCMVIIA